MAFYDFAKHEKPLAPQRFGASKKVIQNTLSVVYCYFWSHFPNSAPKSIKKALRLTSKVDDVLRLCKTSKKPLATQHLGAYEKVVQNTL